MARIAVYGGAFNPPHLAHVFTVAALLSRADVDAVWVLPAYGHVFGKQMAPFEDRLRLLRLAFEGFAGAPVVISDFEGRRQGVSRTYDTLDALEAEHPEHAFMWVMGADNITESHRWHRFDDLVARWPVIVFGRPGHEAALERAAETPWCRPGPAMPDVSSTGLRRALAAGGPETTLRWLPPQIRAEAEALYRPLITPPAIGPVAILGAGRAGLAMAAALKAAGVEVPVIWNRSPRLAATHTGPLAEAMPALSRAPIWLLSVSDEAISAVAADAAAAWRDLGAPPGVALHCAGRLGAEALAPLSALGWAAGSVHPVQTLHGAVGAVEALEGAHCAVEGECAALGAARALVEAWSGHAVELPPGGKAAWHAAAVLAGNGIGALSAAGVALLTSLGLDEAEARAVLAPLQRGTVEAMARGSAAEGLTGPVPRGDVAAISAHVAAISAQRPEWAPLYRALVSGMVAAMGDALDEAVREALLASL